MKHQNRQRVIFRRVSRWAQTMVICGITWVAFACSDVHAAQLSADGNDPVDAQRELSRIGAVIKSLEQEMRSAESNRSEASHALETHERAINTIVNKQRAMQATLEQLNTQLEQLQSAHQELYSQVEQERAKLTDDMRVAYVMGRSDRAQFLFQGRDANSIARLLRYHSYFTRSQRARIQRLLESIEQLALSSAAIARETAQLKKTRTLYQAQREAREAQRNLRAKAITDLNAELTRSQSTLLSLKKDQQRLARLIERLRQAMNDIPAETGPPRSFKSLRGKLPWPVKGTVQRRFGSQRIENGTPFDGVLLASPIGHDVRAIAHGRIVFADWLRGFGLVTIVDHGKGYMSLYAHNQSLYREPGEWVSGGDAIASVGDSGGKDGSGLYFEIRREGKPQNPALWCATGRKFPSNS